MHFGRGAGFNLICNSLMIDRQLCAAAGGWRHGDVIDLHYHKRSPMELAVRIRLSLMQSGTLYDSSLTFITLDDLMLGGRSSALLAFASSPHTQEVGMTLAFWGVSGPVEQWQSSPTIHGEWV